MNLKHVSLDIWNTLIRPRPSYSVLRGILLAKHLGISEDAAEELYKCCDKAVGLRPGPDKDALQRVIDMMFMASDDQHAGQSLPGQRRATLRREMEQLFISHAPQVDLKVVQQMHRMVDRGITFSVTSNVGLMNGDILRQVLWDQSIPLVTHTFDDEVGFRKPDPHIFAAVIRDVQRVRGTSVEPESILHIGDDKVCDIGGTHHGMRCIIIEGVDDLFPVLRELQ